MSNEVRPPTHPPALPVQALVGMAAAVIVLVGMSFARDIIGPLALAAVIVIICHPIRRPLERWGVPRWIATTAVIAVAYAVLAFMAWLLFYAGVQFAQMVGSFANDLQKLVNDLVRQLDDLGLHDQATNAMVSVLQPSSIISTISTVSNTAIGVFTAFFFVLAYVIFMAIDGARIDTAKRHFGDRVAPTLGRFHAFGRGVRRYYVVNASFGAVVAIIDGIALWLLDVPAPLVWAILAFVTNFIPNIGFVLGLIPPAIVALMVGGWPLMLIVIAIYCVVNVVLQVMVQPKFVADAVDLSLTLSFFSVIFWTVIIGPLGAILSIPFTLLVRALLFEGDARFWWIRWLSGDNTVAANSAPGSTAVSPAAANSAPGNTAAAKEPDSRSE